MMLRLYVYDADTAEVLAVIQGQGECECEEKALAYGAGDEIGWTYCPAWGTVEGLHVTENTEYI